MTLTERMERRQAAFLMAIERDPDSFTSELLAMYLGWGSDGADIIFEIFGAAGVDPGRLEDEKKVILERLRNGIAKLDGLTDEQQQKLEELAAAAIEKGFDARLAERWAKRPSKE